MAFTEAQCLERKKGIGGSECAALFGFGYANQTPLSLYFEKRGELDHSVEQSEAMFWGSTLEEPICDVYAERAGVKIRRQAPMKWMKDRETNPLFVSVDRQIIGHPRGPGVLEAKNYSEWSGRNIEELDDVPIKVRVQVMHALAVTGYDWGVIAMLVGGNRLVTFEVERDEEAIQQIVEACQGFMKRVIDGTPPEPMAGSESVLSQVYRRGGGAPLRCSDANVIRVAQELSAWKQRTKEAEDEWDQRKNFFRLLLKDSEELALPGYGAIKWGKTKEKNSRVFNEMRLKREQPDLHDSYMDRVKKPGHRTFKDVPDKADEEER